MGVSEEVLDEMNIPLGHKLKIIKKIKTVRKRFEKEKKPVVYGDL